jgi:hypothetical protein
MKYLIVSLLFIISTCPVTVFGECTKGNCENGQGTYTFSDGSEYHGQWKNSKPHGQGILTYLDRSNYEGQWKNNQRNGQGTYVYPDGSKYVGQFKDNKRHGQGTYTFSDGSKYVGEWENGKINGQGSYIFPNGGKYIGRWKNNKYIGTPKYDEAYRSVANQAAEENPRKAKASKSLKDVGKSENQRYHTVKAGETLYSIGRRYALTVEKIQMLNRLEDKSIIYPGQNLLVAPK